MKIQTSVSVQPEEPRTTLFKPGMLLMFKDEPSLLVMFIRGTSTTDFEGIVVTSGDSVFKYGDVSYIFGYYNFLPYEGILSISQQK